MTPRLVTQPGPLPPIGLRQTANELDVYLGGLWTYIITLILSTLCLGELLPVPWVPGRHMA